jgi:Mn2+/Fe2+ NRAMP family transporter
LIDVGEPTKPRLLAILGPGLVTGAADDDPSGASDDKEFDYSH